MELRRISKSISLCLVLFLIEFGYTKTNERPKCDLTDLINQKYGNPPKNACDRISGLPSRLVNSEIYHEKYNKEFDIEPFISNGEDKNKEIEELFSNIKKHFKEIISKGKSFSLLTQEEKNLFQRIDLVEIVIEKDSAEPKPLSCFGSPQMINFKMYICDSWLSNKTEVSFLLGHELGHVLNTCAASDSIKELLDDNPFSLRQVKESNDLFRLLLVAEVTETEIEKARQEAIHIKTLKDSKFWVGKQAEFKLEYKKHFQSLIEPIPVSKHPLVDVRDCLIAKGVPSKLGPKMFDDSSKQIRQVTPTSLDKVNKDSISIECDGDQNDKMDETFADWFGSQALSNYIYSNRKTNVGIAEISQMFLRSVCKERGKSIKESASDDHLNSFSRFNKIILNSICIQKSLNCSPTEENLIICGGDRIPTREQICDLTNTNKSQYDSNIKHQSTN